jgi:hypothetical protein
MAAVVEATLAVAAERTRLEKIAAPHSSARELDSPDLGDAALVG